MPTASPLPAPSSPVDPQFGAVLSEHRAGGKHYWWRLAGIPMAAAPVLSMIIDGWRDSNLLEAVVPVLALIGVALMLVALSSVQITVYSGGIERRGALRRQRLAWYRLMSYTLDVVDPSPLGVREGGLIGGRGRWSLSGKIAARSVTLLDRDGNTLIVPNRLKDFDALLAALIPTLTEHIVSRVSRELSEGTPVAFGSRLALDPQAGLVFTGLLGKKQTLALREVESMVFARGYLEIRAHGDARPWQSVPIAVIPNVVALQKIALQGSPPPHAGPRGQQFDWAR